MSEHPNYTNMLKVSRNIILRGAPGTGKSHLAKEIAAEIIDTDIKTLHTSKQFYFVQFHPSYDYTDFVEGLKPVSSENGNIQFELKPGSFQHFCYEASKAYSFNQLMKDANHEQAESRIKEKLKPYWDEFLQRLSDNNNELQLNDELTIKKIDETIHCESMFQEHDYDFFISKIIEHYKKIKNKTKTDKKYSYHEDMHHLLKYMLPVDLQNFVFIIDEINRGDIANIFGELFYAIDPGNRGMKGAVKTQYRSMREENEKKDGFFDTFYIPENVYIIGTMNDIDRSVETFDFAMRRRFRFIEVTAKNQLHIIKENLEFDDKQKEIAGQTLIALNKAIEKIDGLNSNYHVGPAYFLTLMDIDYNYDVLWNDYIKPLIAEYVRGLPDADESIEIIHLAFNDGVTNNAHTD